MQRISISVDDELLATIDDLSARRGYASRSEALRDLVREALVREQSVGDGDAQCFATLSYVFEHRTRELAKRLTTEQHHYHDLSVSTLHVHVDEEDCLEVAVLKGSVHDIRAFADSVISQRGVRYGGLHVIPTGKEVRHPHDHD
jgi:CopG family nickel-responsive transcriptional regulator